MKVKLGDYVIITEQRYFTEEEFKKLWPQGIFGKVIDIQKRWNPNNGKKLPDIVIVRVRVKRKYDSRRNSHYKTCYERLEKIEIK